MARAEKAEACVAELEEAVREYRDIDILCPRCGTTIHPGNTWTRVREREAER